jgi:hypothetical protein
VRYTVPCQLEFKLCVCVDVANKNFSCYVHVTVHNERDKGRHIADLSNVRGLKMETENYIYLKVRSSWKVAAEKNRSESCQRPEDGDQKCTVGHLSCQRHEN